MAKATAGLTEEQRQALQSQLRSRISLGEMALTLGYGGREGDAAPTVSRTLIPCHYYCDHVWPAGGGEGSAQSSGSGGSGGGSREASVQSSGSGGSGGSSAEGAAAPGARCDGHACGMCLNPRHILWGTRRSNAWDRVCHNHATGKVPQRCLLAKNFDDRRDRRDGDQNGPRPDDDALLSWHERPEIHRICPP